MQRFTRWAILFISSLIIFLIIALVIDSQKVKVGIKAYRELGSFELGKTFYRQGLIMLDSNMVDSSLFKGKTSLVQFSFAGCGPCIHDKRLFPQLLSDTPNDFQIITLSIDPFAFWSENNQAEERWVKVNIGKSKILESLKVKAYPTYFFIDEEGRIISRPDRGINYVRSRLDTQKPNVLALINEYLNNLKHTDRLNAYLASYSMGYLLLFSMFLLFRWLYIRAIKTLKRRAS